MSTTARLGLALMATSTLSKETVFNEAVATLDALVHPKALSATIASPPGTPSLGDVYIIPVGATGAWAGHDNKIAVYTTGWKYLDPISGFFIWVADTAKTYRYDEVTLAWVENVLTVSNLTDLTDVDAGDLSTGALLRYDATAGKYALQLVALDDLSNVSAAAPNDGQVLAWVSANAAWEVSDVPPMTGAAIKAAYEGEANTNAFTDAEKTKLAGLDGSKYLGTYVSLTALNAAQPAPAIGSYAHVDAGAGSDVQLYIWDNDDAKFVVSAGGGGTMTGAAIKVAYEGEPDTNAFTDAEKAKLAGVEAGATADQTDQEIVTAYNAVVAQVTGPEITAGTATTVRRFSPKDVTDMVLAHAPAGGTPPPAPYDVRLGFTATPTAGQVIDTIMVVRDINFPADFSGSLGTIGTLPTANMILTLKADGVAVGTTTIDTAGVFTFATTGGTTQTIATGAILTLEAPATADATAANAAFTLMGTV
jgi:hypothetical protein